MRQSTFETTVLFLCCALILTSCSKRDSHDQSATDKKGEATNAYYGFYPSSKGTEFKQFRHNIFGFAIDIPSTWVFGVNGTPPTAVVFLFKEGLNTAKLSKDYEVVEIGQIPFGNMGLEEAQLTVMRGMRAKHPNLKIVASPTTATLNGRPSISWTYQWPSKTGYTVVEYVTLVQSKSGMRSLAVRTTREDISFRYTFYDSILGTFEPYKPKH